VGELEAAFRTATGARAGALLVLAGGVLYPQTRRVAELAARSRLPLYMHSALRSRPAG
jgi:hypothetical protein